MQCDLTYTISEKEITTSHFGYNAIMKFYAFCKPHKYKKIELNLWGIEMLEANLSALLISLIDKLREENKIFIYCQIPNHLSILNRNCFAKLLYKSDDDPFDNRESTIKLYRFHPSKDDEFVKYLNKDFFNHRGLSNLNGITIKNLKTAFQEIFVNVELHAKTDRLYTCGQYFPAKNVLKFTLIDMGVGFLHRIKEFTKGQITKDVEAIEWATKPKNSTKDKMFGPGGYGLQDIIEYCQNNNGSIHIVSGSGYWTMSGKLHMRYPINVAFPGSMIHLIFRKI
ncbi:MAG: hypothetical protein ABJH05_05935 [Fulvivirga sp.]